MKGNEFSKKTLSEQSENWIKKLAQVLELKEYGKGTKRNYVQEMTLLFKYYYHKRSGTYHATRNRTISDVH